MGQQTLLRMSNYLRISPERKLFKVVCTLLMTHDHRQLCNVIFRLKFARLILAGNCLETLFIAKLIVYKSGFANKLYENKGRI